MTEQIKGLILEDGSFFVKQWAKELGQIGFELLGQSPEDIACVAKMGRIVQLFTPSLNEMHLTSRTTAFAAAVQQNRYNLCLLSGSVLSGDTFEVVGALLAGNNPPKTYLMSDSRSSQFQELLARPEIVALRQTGVIEVSSKSVIENLSAVRKAFTP